MNTIEEARGPFWQAITVRQPFASAIAIGGKPLENRSWKFPGTIELPRYIAIHAGRELYDLSAEGARELMQLWPGLPQDEADLPMSAIVGIVKVIRTSNLAEARTWCANNGIDERWAVGPCCWMMPRRIALKTPIPYKGAQGLWPVRDAAAIAALDDVLRPLVSDVA